MPAFNDVVPEMNGIEQRHMIPKRSWNESFKRIIPRLTGAYLAINLITRSIVWVLHIDDLVMDDSAVVDEL